MQRSIIRRGAAGVPVIIDLTYRGQCRVPHQICAPVGPPPPILCGAPVGPIVPMAPFTARQLGQPRPASFFTATPPAVTVGGEGGSYPEAMFVEEECSPGPGPEAMSVEDERSARILLIMSVLQDSLLGEQLLPRRQLESGGSSGQGGTGCARGPPRW